MAGAQKAAEELERFLRSGGFSEKETVMFRDLPLFIEAVEPPEATVGSATQLIVLPTPDYVPCPKCTEPLPYRGPCLRCAQSKKGVAQALVLLLTGCIIYLTMFQGPGEEPETSPTPHRSPTPRVGTSSTPSVQTTPPLRPRLTPGVLPLRPTPGPEMTSAPGSRVSMEKVQSVLEKDRGLNERAASVAARLNASELTAAKAKLEWLAQESEVKGLRAEVELWPDSDAKTELARLLDLQAVRIQKLREAAAIEEEQGLEAARPYWSKQVSDFEAYQRKRTFLDQWSAELTGDEGDL